MNTVFADTSFYIALLRPDDAQHQRSLAFDLRYQGLYVTSEFILIELGNWLADPRDRPVFLQLCSILRANPRTTILPVSADWFAQGMNLYAARLDKKWSFTDCISFQMMHHHNLTDALTSDHHFTQAGFKALLGDDSN